MSDDRKPPEIVASAESPECALAAFIAQELEHWGFVLALAGDPSAFGVRAGAEAFEVQVWRFTESGRKRYGL